MEQEILDVGSMAYEAVSAILVHKKTSPQDDSHTVYRDDGVPSYFITEHRIRHGQICEGFPITRKKLEALCKQLLPSLGSETSYLPENVVSYNPITRTLIWFSPGRKRHLFFDKSTHIKSGISPIPPLLFVYCAGTLSLRALKENQRPRPETILWENPFFNGSCMGTVSLPQTATPADSKKLEDMYFRTAFTFAHTPILAKGTAPDGLWKSLVGTGAEEFPLDCLVKAGTLKELLARRTNGH